MDRLNKTLAISLATLTLAGSAPQIFAARTSHGASKQTGTSSSKKTDYTKPVKENETQIEQTEKIIDKITRKIREYENSHKRETLDEIYRLVSGKFFRVSDEFILYFDDPSEKKEKIDFVINFVKENLKSDIDKLHKILEPIRIRKNSTNYELLTDEKHYLMKMYELLCESDDVVSFATYEQLFASGDYGYLKKIVEHLKEKESIEQEKLEQERLEQERLEQERLEKQRKLEEAITEICGCIEEYRKRNGDEDKLNKVYKAILENISENKISFDNNLKIQTYQENDSNFDSQKGEVEEFLFNLIEKDTNSIKKQSSSEVNFDGVKRMPFFTKNSFIRIKSLCNASPVLRNYIMKNLNDEINIEKVKKIVNFINLIYQR